MKEEGDFTHRYTVTTRMIPAFRWAAMRALFNVSLAVRDKVTRQKCSQTTQLLITSSFRCVCVNVSAGVAVPVSMFVCACI